LEGDAPSDPEKLKRWNCLLEGAVQVTWKIKVGKYVIRNKKNKNETKKRPVLSEIWLLLDEEKNKKNKRNKRY
jgi:hypothetical protein